jgi:hypothetical protein
MVVLNVVTIRRVLSWHPCTIQVEDVLPVPSVFKNGIQVAIVLEGPPGFPVLKPGITRASGKVSVEIKIFKPESKREPEIYEGLIAIPIANRPFIVF